nr:hypothetical protein [Tanacetum cinerariifolium]
MFLEGTPARGTYSLQPGVLGGDTCEGYIFISAWVFLEGTSMMGTHGFHYYPSVLGGDTYDGYLVHRFHELGVIVIIVLYTKEYLRGVFSLTRDYCGSSLTSHSSVDIQQPATFEPNREATPFSVHRSSPWEGVLSQVPGSSSCGLSASHKQRMRLIFSINILSCLLETSCHSICNDSPRTGSVANEDFKCRWANIASAPNSLGKEIILDFEQSAIRLASSERHLKRDLLKPRHFRDERYGCLFQQLGSVETKGQSFGAGQETYVTARDVNANESINSQGSLWTPASMTGSNHVTLPSPMLSKRARCSVLKRPLSSEASP